MICKSVRPRLSEYLDGGLPAETSQAVAAHLDRCETCSALLRSLRLALELLAYAPRLRPVEAIAPRVLDRLDIENRQPSLAVLFRPAWSHAAHLVAGLAPAALVLAGIFAVALGLGPDQGAPRAQPGPGTAERQVAPWGTEANPVFPSSEVSAPQVLTRGSLDPLTGVDETSLFFETVVARDGSVSTVTLLQGDSAGARPILDALRSERFEPGRFRGRPVAVSVYRLISRILVSAGSPAADLQRATAS